MEKFDYVIVGAGSAGCVLANRLSEDPSARVLLLEAGPRDRNIWLHIPVGYFKTVWDDRYTWRFETEPEPGTNNRRMPWPRGRVLGGTSAINGLVYIRGQQSDYDHWRQLGNTGWGWEDVFPYFLKSEDQERGKDDWHGTGGPLAVSDLRMRHEICDAYLRAANEAGIPLNADFNGATQEGAGYYQLNTRNGWRCSTATAYLKPAMARANLTVVTGASVAAIEFTGRRATGVKYRQGGVLHHVEAAAEILLSAGAIGSPHLLQVSGIGPGDVLKAIDTKVHHDLPGVGANLQDHFQVRMMYRCPKPITINDQARSLMGLARIVGAFAVGRRGAMSVGAAQIGIFARSRPDIEAPDVQFHMFPLSTDRPGLGLRSLHTYPGFTSCVCQLRPESRGQIIARSPDITRQPAILPNFLSATLDQETIVGAVRIARRIAATSQLKPYVSEEVSPGAAADSDAAILDAARNTGVTIFHPAGTCKMGSDPNAVVDERLRVHGMEGLRVVDASVMPTLISGNTNGPVVMIAEKAADMIRADARTTS